MIFLLRLIFKIKRIKKIDYICKNLVIYLYNNDV